MRVVVLTAIAGAVALGLRADVVQPLQPSSVVQSPGDLGGGHKQNVEHAGAAPPSPFSGGAGSNSPPPAAEMPEGFLLNAPALPLDGGLMEAKKPQVPPELVSYFPRFVQHPPAKEWPVCREVLDEIGFNSPAFVALQNLLLYLERELQQVEHGAAITADKTVAAGFRDVYAFILHEEHDQGTPLLQFIPKLIMCDVDVENGRGIYQLLWEFGLTQSLKELFVTEVLQRGLADFQPHLQLDKKGNTLLHLAAMSRQPKLLPVLESRVKLHYQDMAQYTFYMLASLNHENNEGKKPIELADPQMRSRLKTKFRNLAEFARRLVEDTSSYSSETMKQLKSQMRQFINDVEAS